MQGKPNILNESYRVVLTENNIHTNVKIIFDETISNYSLSNLEIYIKYNTQNSNTSTKELIIYKYNILFDYEKINIFYNLNFLENKNKECIRIKNRNSKIYNI